MSAPATSPVAWKSGRNFGCWHVCWDADLWKTCCGLAVPQRPLQNVSRVRGRSKEPTCRSCERELEKHTAANLKLERA